MIASSGCAGSPKGSGLELPGSPHPTRLVFTDGRGGPWRRSNLLRRSGTRCSGGRGYRASRSTCSATPTRACPSRRGPAYAYVADRLGHARASTTIDVYAQSLPGSGRALAVRLGHLLGQADAG
jgi:integrase